MVEDMSVAVGPDLVSVALPSYAGAIVRAPDGRLLCQLRDDRPEIVCPGTWCSCPGGRMEYGETPEEAVLRELQEEFEIGVVGLTPLLMHIENAGEYRGIYHAFYANLSTSVVDVKCNEGMRVDFFTPQQVAEFSQHPVSLIFMQAYMQLVSDI